MAEKLPIKTMEKKIKKPEVKIEKVEVKPSHTNLEHEKKLYAIIRIDGEVKVKPHIANTLFRLRLRRKYTCVLIYSQNKSQLNMIKKVKHAIAYGEIEKETLVKLLEARAQKIGEPKFNASEIAEEVMKGKRLDELGFKPFFRLHPPRKGINSKLQYPKGVLGNNKKDINKLLERML